MNIMRISVSIIAFLLALPTAGTARGVLLAPEDLDQTTRAGLRAEIAAARTAAPEAFQRLADLRGRLAGLDAAKRGPLPVLLPRLQALGQEALLPLLEEIAFNAPERGALTDSALLGWRASILEAVGKLRDPRSVPVLRAVVTLGPAHRLITAAAAGAYGKLLTDEAAAWLVDALTAADGERRLGILQGLGHCRRAVATDALAAALRARPDAEEAKLLARSLGNAGSSWAWQTPVVSATGEEAAVRRTAAEALAAAWPLYDGQAQKKLGHALLVVEFTGTPALLRAAVTGANAETQASAEKLIERFLDRSFRVNPTP